MGVPKFAKGFGRKDFEGDAKTIGQRLAAVASSCHCHSAVAVHIHQLSLAKGITNHSVSCSLLHV